MVGAVTRLLYCACCSVLALLQRQLALMLAQVTLLKTNAVV